MQHLTNPVIRLVAAHAATAVARPFALSLLAATILVAPAAAPAAALSAEGQEHLLTSYYRLILAKEAPQQVATLIQGAPESVQSQVKAAAADWARQRIAAIRPDLEAQFGPDARDTFEAFLKRYTAAERAGDHAFLSALSSGLALPSPRPADYGALRSLMMETRLRDDVEATSAFLGEIQTWADVRRRNADAPTLAAWLGRHDPPPERVAATLKTEPGRTGTPMDPLEAAEADFSRDDVDVDAFESPLDAFAGGRRAKREKKLAEAQAGMQQVAAERQAAEEAYAQKKMAQAEAEAEGMRRMAEELAAVEQQAFEQRQQSWSARLKRIVATAGGSFVGGFTGGLASRAAEEALIEIWPTD